jgi:hypothetical protein
LLIVVGRQHRAIEREGEQYDGHAAKPRNGETGGAQEARWICEFGQPHRKYSTYFRRHQPAAHPHRHIVIASLKTTAAGKRQTLFDQID